METSDATAAQSIQVDTSKLDQLVMAESLVRRDPEMKREGQSRLTRELAQLGRFTNAVQRTALSTG